MLRMPQIRQRLGYQKQSLMSQATSAPMLPKMPLKRHSTVQRDANPPPQSFWSFWLSTLPLYSRISKYVPLIELELRGRSTVAKIKHIPLL